MNVGASLGQDVRYKKYKMVTILRDVLKIN